MDNNDVSRNYRTGNCGDSGKYRGGNNLLQGERKEINPLFAL